MGVKKLVTVVGARPQFIKAAPLSRTLSSLYSSTMREYLVHTGQHYDPLMSDVFFDELEIPRPEFNLGVGSAKPGKQTALMLEGIEAILDDIRPDCVIVYGDTNSTLAGSLAASKLQLPLFHVEAGLRSWNMIMPEEQNRIITDHLSSVLFCPTETAVVNLEAEGIVDGKKVKTCNGKPIAVKNVGDISYDAVSFNLRIAEEKSNILNELKLRPKSFLLSTVHRAENTDDKKKLESIFAGFALIPKEIILALHPRTRKCMGTYSLSAPGNVRIIEPVGYLDMLLLERDALAILTDSGGIQKEAFLMETPCITIREETEWVETVDCGWNLVVGYAASSIAGAFQRFEDHGFRSLKENDSSKTAKRYPFGTGRTASAIAEFINAY